MRLEIRKVWAIPTLILIIVGEVFLWRSLNPPTLGGGEGAREIIRCD